MKKDLSNKEIIQDLYARPPEGLKYKKTNLIQIFDGSEVIAEYDSAEDKAIVKDKKKFKKWKDIAVKNRNEIEKLQQLAKYRWEEIHYRKKYSEWLKEGPHFYEYEGPTMNGGSWPGEKADLSYEEWLGSVFNRHY